MADEIHEAPMVHGRLSCSSMSVVELSRGLTITGVDNTVFDSNNLLQATVAQQTLSQHMPREFNIDISDVSTTPVIRQRNTFTSGGVSVVDGIHTVQVPANGIYSVNILSNNMLTAQHKVLKLGDSFAEMTDPINFQSGSSFSMDLEWRGTTMADVGMDVPIVSTSDFSLSCEQLSSSSYGVRLTVNDGASTITIPDNPYELHKDVWYKIGIVWFAPENSLFLYINNIHVFSDTLTTFGSHTARPFTFGKNLSNGDTGGNYEFKWIRFHQSPLNAKQIRDLIAPSTLDVDGFRAAVVFTGAESSPTIPTIQKNSAVLENTPSSDYDATISIVVGDTDVGGSISGEVVKRVTTNSYAENISLNTTVLAKSGQFITISAHNISPVSFNVYALNTDNVIIPSIVLSGSDVLLERTQAYSDPGFSATEVDSLGNSSDMTSSVVTTGSVDNLNAGENTIQYTLTSSDNLVSVTQIRVVSVIDTVKPIIVMRGSSTITHERGTNYGDLGADATDENIDLTSKISVHSTVNQNVVGTYTVTYNAVDSRGNAAIPVVRTVNVVDNISPSLQLTGNTSVSVNQGESYSEQGARIIDSGVDIGPATPSGTVNVNTPGSYTITYNGSDAAGNAATPITRTILVESSTIITANANYVQIGQDIDGEALEDQSGISVSINSDGTIVAIGAPHNDANSSNSGHTRVHQYDGTQWVQIGQDIDSTGYSGYSVSINSDGTIVAIGGHKGNETRVYEYDGTQWVQIGQDIDGEANSDSSGWSVSINSDGTIVAIGAINNDANGGNSGHTRVYQYVGTQWVQMGQDIHGQAAQYQSGWSVSINSDGSIVAIGEPRNDANGLDAGNTRVYKYDASASQWVQMGQDISGQNLDDHDNSGHSVSINSDGTIVAITAICDDDGGANSGNTRVYEYNGTQWVQIGQDIDGESNHDRSGSSVSINSDGTIVAIGANANDGNGSGNSGHTRVYHYSSTLSEWVKIGEDIDGEATQDESGSSVSISGDGTTVAIGAPKSDANGNNSGSTRVYKLTNI